MSEVSSGKMAATAIHEWMYVWITVSHLGQKVSAKCKRKKEKKNQKKMISDRSLPIADTEEDTEGDRHS